MEFKIAHASPETEMLRHFLHAGSVQIYASGDVEAGDAQRLADFAQSRRIDRARVNFNSPGGDLGAGLLLGETIRKLGFDTAVSARERGNGSVCASAAAYAFAGGINRFYDGNGALGVHRFYSDVALSADQAQLISGSLVMYLRRMGVDAAAFALACEGKPDSMIWLDPAEAAKLGFANNGTHPTTAEIRLSGREHYLRLEQLHHDVTSRVLILPDQTRFVMMAGIVTTEASAMEHSGALRSYVELDGQERLVIEGGGVQAEGSTVWLERVLGSDFLAQFQQSKIISIWTEQGGPFRWGATMELAPVREALVSFIRNHQSSQG